MRSPRRLFAYRLALAVGTWDVMGMLAAIDPEQLDEWMAFDLLEPICLTATERAEARYRPPFQTQSAAEQMALLGIAPARPRISGGE